MAEMRLAMTLVVRDEEEILAANLDYHLAQGVDVVLVTDHGSTDATPEILDEYARCAPVEVFREEGVGLHQGEWVTRMARRAATEHGADWVINNDCDEFWWPLAGTLKDMLAAIPERYGQMQVPRYNFIPRPGDGPFWERMTVRESRSYNLIGEELEPNAVHRAHPDVQVEQGNHGVDGPGLDIAPRVPLIEVFHFPARSIEQFERKVIKQGRGHSAVEDRPPGVGRDQLALYAAQQRGELEDMFRRMRRKEEPEVEAELADGELVIDARLAEFMSELEDGVPRPPRPLVEAVAIRRLADAAFEIAERAEMAEAVLAGADARTEEAERFRRELAETTIALQAVRDSKLFRSTRGLRQVWYRARGRKHQ